MRTHDQVWKPLISIVSYLWLAAMPALAAEPRVPMRLVQVGDVQYISGGVSKKERADLETRAIDFRLLVSFVGQDSEQQVRQVSVKLTKRGARNKPIDLETSGPMLLMSIPTGHYSLVATLPGREPVETQFELQPGEIEELHVVLEPESGSR